MQIFIQNTKENTKIITARRLLIREEKYCVYNAKNYLNGRGMKWGELLEGKNVLYDLQRT